MTAGSATTLTIRVAANAIGLARSGKGSADTTQPEETANCGGNGFERLPPRGGAGQAFGQLIKLRGLHLLSSLSTWMRLQHTLGAQSIH